METWVMPLHGALKIGFLVSHGGSSMKAISQAIADDTLKASVCVVICNNSNAPRWLMRGCSAYPRII
jgi:hypothetical protein